MIGSERTNLLSRTKAPRVRGDAYLHRKEGDQDNAAYWYSREALSVCQEPLDAEWRGITRDLLR